MTVPTPETWSTWTAMARRVGGTSTVEHAVELVSKYADSSCVPAVILRRAMLPTTSFVELNAVVLRSVSTLRSWVVSMSSVTVAPSGMSLTAMTAGRTVGTGGGPPAVPPPPPFSSKAIPTNAMTARNTPTSRTSRFERFKFGLPESCDRWQHCSTGERPRDYTNGLGPLGGFSRQRRTAHGDSQGPRNRTEGDRTTPHRTLHGRCEAA